MYGYGTPILFLSGFLCVTLLVMVDKALIAYWYKPLPIQSDLLNRTFLMILKYAPCLCLLTTAACIKANYCITENAVKPQTYFNEFIYCSQTWALPDCLYALFVVYTLAMIFCDFLILRKNKGRFKRLYSDTDFFS
jgi:hypothetical protein